ncbi:MAG: penicillin-binding protein, partial [Deltaproteobacteria bacterium]|nr:penicillin-binding protein [Deltaproteobacteria bacterium]MBW2529974.1 penicillin-binding protein [Deltaproteobacteria bacterium]
DEDTPPAGQPLEDGAVAAREPPLRLRQALARSVNRAATWALGELGAEEVVRWARSLGVRSKLAATESLALGAYELTPRELAEVYGTFAADGVHQAPLLIRRVVGPDGGEVALPERPPPRRVLEPAEAYVVTSLLTSVVQEGTGRRARALERSIAGKTGTSNAARDAWFAGYSTDIVCVVWTGFDDAVPLGARESGATAALPAFVDFMQKAHESREPQRFTVPSGVARVAIDPVSGLLAYEGQTDSVHEVFVEGTEPSEEADVPDAGADAAAGAGGGAVQVEPYDDWVDPSQPVSAADAGHPSAGGGGPADIREIVPLR